MAQAKSRDDALETSGKTAEAAGELADGMAQTAQRAAEMADEASDRALGAVEAVAEEAPALRLVLDRATPVLREAAEARHDLVALWLEATREQTEHAIETMRQLAETRDWREALQLQSDYLNKSMARLCEAMLQQVQVTGGMAAGMMAGGRKDLRDAA